MRANGPEIAVLVSVGRNPTSARPRRADRDARALELALRVALPERISVVHAGDCRALVLKDYLGMGVPRLTCVEVLQGDDPLPALAAWLEVHDPRLVLAGTTAETGESSGMVPYWLAHRLNLRLVPAIVSLQLTGATAELTQAVRGGRRRRLVSPLPLIATVGERAPAPRLPTFGQARRGLLETVSAAASTDERSSWVGRPARERPSRAMQSISGNATDRFRILRGETMPSDEGNSADRPLVGLDPDGAAARILRYLRDEGLLAK
jgi:electron transfer flavoprotein beta subunit